MSNRLFFSWLIVLFSAFLLSACGDPQTIKLEGQTMGTYYNVKYVPTTSSPSPAQLQKEIDRLLEEVNDQMSTYRPHSELSLFNSSKEVNTAFTVSPATAKVVAEAIRINQLTEGALDITVGPLVNLWGFGPELKKIQAPSEQALAERRAWTGIDKLQVNNNTLSKSIPELYLDLSSIAKGYGVDVVAEYLERQNIHNYMVDIGGELRTKGKNDQHIGWRIAIERPVYGQMEQTAQEIIQPGDLAIATSGDYRNYFEQEGVRYSHTIDPTTAKPINHNLVSITVLADNCMTADGFSTGLNVLGPERGLAIAEKLNMPVFMIIKTEQGFEERYTTAFAPFLKK